MRIASLTLALALAGGLLSGCGATADENNGDLAASPASEGVSEPMIAEAAPPPPSPAPPAPPMGYDQAVRCAYLADSLLYNPATQTSGLTTEQLTLMVARAREAAYAAAPREERVAAIDADMRQLGYDQYVSSGASRGSGLTEEENQRIDDRIEARRMARDAEIKGVCASLLD